MKIRHLPCVPSLLQSRLSKAILAAVVGVGLGASTVVLSASESSEEPQIVPMQVAIEGLNEILGRKGLRCELLPFVFQ